MVKNGIKEGINEQNGGDCDCNFSEKTCMNQDGLSTHINKISIEENMVKKNKNSKKAKKSCDWECEFCEKIYATQPGLSRHITTHHFEERNDKKKKKAQKIFEKKMSKKIKKYESSKFKCATCHIGYKLKSSLERHNYKKHSDLLKMELTLANHKIKSQTCEIKYKNREIKHKNEIINIKDEHKNEIINSKDETIDVQSKTIKLLQDCSGTMITNNNNNNNKITNNNNITINVYLDEHCKNAMNLKDFIEKMKLTVQDVVDTANNGYVSSMSNIVIRELKNLPSTKRPLHCTDAKRGNFVVKEDDKWEKDKKHEKMKGLLHKVSIKNRDQFKEWQRQNPNYKKNEEKFKTCNKMMMNMFGGTSEEIVKNNKLKAMKEIGEKTNIKKAIKEI